MNIAFDLIILVFVVVALCSNQSIIAVVFIVFGFVSELADHQRQIEVLKDKIEKQNNK